MNKKSSQRISLFHSSFIFPPHSILLHFHNLNNCIDNTHTSLLRKHSKKEPIKTKKPFQHLHRLGGGDLISQTTRRGRDRTNTFDSVKKIPFVFPCVDANSKFCMARNLTQKRHYLYQAAHAEVLLDNDV